MKKNNLPIFIAVFSAITLVSAVFAILGFVIESLGTIFGIVFLVITIIALAFLGITIYLYIHGKHLSENSYNIVRARKRQTLSPTCTIQISTEYLVKEKYTQEEADKTIQQLYSLHENEGFSQKDFETIKAKIESRIVDKKNND